MDLKQFKTIFEESYNEAIQEHQENLIFEASRFREPVLKKIDSSFQKMKKTAAFKGEDKRNLQKLVSEFTGATKVYVSVKKNMMNAYIIPIYNGILFKDIKDKKNSAIKNTMLSGDIQNSKYIDKLYITFGDQLIETLQPTELTAVLLHELGHAFLHTSHVRVIVNLILRKISFILGVVLYFNSIPFSFFPWLVVLRTLNFLDHLEEYNADKYAVKYGYADDMSRVLIKFHNIETKNKSKIHIFLIEVLKFILLSSHPRSKSRLSKLKKTYQKKYAELYPDLKQDITIIFQNLK